MNGDTHDRGQGTIELRDYLHVLRARKWTVIATTILVAVGAIGFSFLQTPRYRAEAKVLVDAPGDFPSERLETERQVAASQPVAEIVRNDVGTELSQVTLLDDLTVEAIPDTVVLSFTYTAADPGSAQRYADAFARAYIMYRREQALQQVEADRAEVQGQIDAATQQLDEITRDLQGARDRGDDALVATLEASRNSLLARLGVLQQRVDDLETQPPPTGVVGGDIIQAAELPTSPYAPNHILNAVLGILVGVTLGVGLAFLRERLDDRFRGREDVETVLAAPVLATLPKFRFNREERFPALVTTWQPRGIASESYRTLRTGLQFTTLQRSIRSVMVTSAAAEEGKTVTTANLAVVLANAGQRVILISADLRKPTLESLFGLEDRNRTHGLSTWLAGEDVDWADVLMDPGIPNLRVLPCGPIPPNPAELLTSSRLKELLDEMQESCDLVLIDSPPVLAVTDAAILASAVGGAVMVIDIAQTHRSAVERAKEEVDRAGGHVVGTVLNQFDSSSTPYYYGPYDYSSAEQEDGDGESGRGDGQRRTRLGRRLRVG